MFRVASNLWIDRMRRTREIAEGEIAEGPAASTPPAPVLDRGAAGSLIARLSPQERAAVAGEVARMKRQAGKDLVLFAGAGIAATFMNLDLVDEYRLMVHPVALGAGIPLFGGLERELALELVSARSLPSGVVLQTHRRVRD